MSEFLQGGPEYGITIDAANSSSLFRDGDLIWTGDLPAIQLCDLLQGCLGLNVVSCDHCIEGRVYENRS